MDPTFNADADVPVSNNNLTLAHAVHLWRIFPSDLKYIIHFISWCPRYLILVLP